MNFGNFGVAARLYLVTSVLVLVLAGVSVLSWNKSSNVRSFVARTQGVTLVQLGRAADMELNVTRLSLQLRHAMLVKTPTAKADTLADISAKRKILDTLLSEFETALDTPEKKANFAKVPKVFAEFWVDAEVNLKLIEADQRDDAFAYLVDKTIPTRNRLLALLSSEKNRLGAQLADDIGGVVGNSIDVRNDIAGVTLLVAVVLLLLAWHVGSLLRRRVALAAGMAIRVRDGDLVATVDNNVRDEFSPLLSALNDMQASLIRVVSTVRMNAESVATASAEIAQGNNDLSSRTEQQATALEETAASMEQLGATVRHNADNAKQASQLAMKASSVAVVGGNVVTQVVETMKGINDSSRKIADIIGVIDGIAFQTNILALNAAVEAARAGEQGRGFAVVAGEVRSLAQRSADAAKEIKGLINASVERVGHGTLLVDKAGETMAEVVSSIKRVTDIVGEISSASQEQSMGVQQVGQAVMQMDQATQQNAALVEQSAAAADTLKVQALTLVEAVAVFQLPGGRSVNFLHSVAVKRATSMPAPTRVPLRKPVALAGASASRMTAPPKSAAQFPATRPSAAALASPKSPAPSPAPKAVASGGDDWESF